MYLGSRLQRVQLQRVLGYSEYVFATKSLNTMLQNSVTKSTHLKRGVYFASFYPLQAGPSVPISYPSYLYKYVGLTSNSTYKAHFFS